MKTYYLLTRVSRQAVLAEAKATGTVQYAVTEADTETGHRLNWFRELPANEGWHQGVAGDIIIMDVKKEED